jgi:pimeloyl-ACP methyl ester carboxylesterase
MDDAEIQYCTTPDGVNLALHVIGSGAPIVFVPGAFVTEDQIREFLQRLAETYAVVCFDARGSGLSDRDARDYSLVTRAADRWHETVI